MPNFLFMDGLTGAGGATCAAYQYVNSTPIQIGNTFGTGPWTGSHKNMLTQFGGELYAVAQDGVYKKDDPTVMTGGWTSQITFTSPQAGAASGLVPVEIDGVTNLVLAFRSNDTATSWRWVKFDGTTWSQAGSATALTALSSAVDMAVYRGVIHIVGVSGTNLDAVTFDPSTDSFAKITEAIGSNNFDPALCVFEDRLFMAYRPGGDEATIAEFAGGSWGDVLELQTGVFFQTFGRMAFFTDGTNMYVICCDQTAFEVWQIDAALTKTDITFTVLPLAFRTPADGGSFSGDERGYYWQAIYDQESVPGTTTVYLSQASSGAGGTPRNLYRWNGNASLMTAVDTGGDVRHQPPTQPLGGGCTWTAGELDVRIVARDAVLGGEQLSFIAYGGGTGRSFKLRYAVAGNPSPAEATLALPVTGGSAALNDVANQVEGIAADGVTVYTIVWDIGSDGVLAGTVLDRFPQIQA